ncbi:MAG TPA: hypothetical protein VF407_14040, partial [Polyangiaceae bacterium]
MQIACQLALLVPSLGSARVLFRSAAFGISLVALTVTASNRTTKRHPGAVFVLFILFVLGLEAFHSDTNGPLAALATLAMNSAVLGPLIWAPRLAIDKKWFRRTVLLFWAFQSTSALVGALQSYFPNTFQPVTPFLDKQALAGLTIALANGESILRPSGLTDTPGGAAVAGTYAAILSLGLWFEFAKIWQRAIFVFTMAIGIYTIYLGQVRSLLLMVAISMLVIAGVYAVSGKLRNAVGLTILVVAIAGGSFVAAVGIGGDEVTNRFRTLVEGAPSDVYYANRGRFLEQTV